MAASRSCGRTVSATSAELGVRRMTASGAPCWPWCPTSEHPSPRCLDRLAHEYGLKDALDGAWAVRPLALERERGASMLMLEDPGGEPLERLLGTPMAMGSFLPLAVGIAAALGKLHARGLVHKDLKPAHLLVNCADGQVRLTGFGLASRLPRERQAPAPPEFIAGTLAYMAPEQTGRMNRSINSRSDLYALGVVLYQMLTGDTAVHRRPIPWSGSTAISPESRCRPPSGWRRSRPRSRTSS